LILRETLRIVSDDEWRVSPNFEPRWELVEFDDSDWEYTVAPAGNCAADYCWDDPDHDDVLTMWSFDQHQTIYLRRSFVLDVSTVFSATVWSGCDDDHDLYINGVLVASDWNGFAGPTLVTDIKPYLNPGVNTIAVKASDTYGGCRYMCVDAIIVTPPRLWLTVDPEFGTVPTESSIPIQVTFDATDLEPDIYTTTLYVLSNDPLNPIITVPVTMTVTTLVTPTAVTIGGAEDGFAGNLYTFIASVEPISASLPIHYLWQASGQEPITHTGGISDTVSFT
jgi:hypothetical protein